MHSKLQTTYYLLSVSLYSLSLTISTLATANQDNSFSQHAVQQKVVAPNQTRKEQYPIKTAITDSNQEDKKNTLTESVLEAKVKQLQEDQKWDYYYCVKCVKDDETKYIACQCHIGSQMHTNLPEEAMKKIHIEKFAPLWCENCKAEIPTKNKIKTTHGMHCYCKKPNKTVVTPITRVVQPQSQVATNRQPIKPVPKTIPRPAPKTIPRPVQQKPAPKTIPRPVQQKPVQSTTKTKTEGNKKVQKKIAPNKHKISVEEFIVINNYYGKKGYESYKSQSSYYNNNGVESTYSDKTNSTHSPVNHSGGTEYINSTPKPNSKFYDKKDEELLFY